jgi:hypothetical protein
MMGGEKDLRSEIVETMLRISYSFFWLLVRVFGIPIEILIGSNVCGSMNVSDGEVNMTFCSEEATLGTLLIMTALVEFWLY